MAAKETFTTGNKLTRVGSEFVKVLTSIQEVRLRSGKDKKRTSLKKLSNLIIKHNSWALIQRDILALEEIK